MKVKKGMASNVSFDITPHSRSGIALSSGQERLMQSDSGASFDADDEEQEAVCCERECHRIAEQQEHDQRHEHDRREVFSDEFDHAPFSSAVSSGAWVGT